MTFETAPYSVALPFAKLDCFADYFPVGDAAGVAVVARRVKEIACPRVS